MGKFACLLIGLFLMGITLPSCGKYQSSIEAKNACEGWAKEGGTYYLQGVHKEYRLENIKKHGTGLKITRGELVDKRPIRYCEEDAKTQKYIGFAFASRKDGEIVEINCNGLALGGCTAGVILDMRQEVDRRFSY